MKKFKLPEKIAELHEHIWRISTMDDVVFSSISLKQAKKIVKFYNIFNGQTTYILAKSFRKAKFGWFGIFKSQLKLVVLFHLRNILRSFISTMFTKNFDWGNWTFVNYATILSH